MERKIHTLIQGSAEWDQFRLEHHGASEAAAMLGLSKKTSRTELLRMKHTGIAKEFSDWVQKNILDHGHEVEALARPHIEALIGDELYPATMSFGKLSASCDGLTMMGDVAFEHKQWAAALAESVRRGELPEEHQPQCQQVLYVTGADRLIFMVSDGTPENMVHMEVRPDKAWQDRIVSGWKQFDEDLAAYVPQEIIPAAVAAPQMSLPAVAVNVEGSIAIRSNLAVFGDALTAYIERINKNPETDQDFADLEATVKKLKETEEALDAAETNALAQTDSIDEMRRTVALYRDMARSNRLTITKLVTSEKENRRAAILREGQEALAAHIAKLNARMGKPYMPVIQPEFQAVMKGLKSLDSMKDKVATELSRCKIEANEIADRIEANLKTLRELAANHAFLFADTAQIVLKPADDLTALVKLRIAEHKEAEEKKLEADRQRIRDEEEAKARAKVAAEERARQEEAARKEREAQAAAAAEAAKKIEEDRIATRPAQAPVAPQSPEAQVSVAPVPIQTHAHAAPDTVRIMMNLTEICTRLDFNVSAGLLDRLGYQAKPDKASKLYREADFPAICQALINHIAGVANQRKAA